MAISLPVLPTRTGDDAATVPTANAPHIDFRIDYQLLRHSGPARFARHALYRMFVGRQGWPLRFHAPESDADVPVKVSPHLYVHLPFCQQICPHCPYTKTLLRDGGAVSRYGAALFREIDTYRKRSAGTPVTSLYFGGGTPTATPELIAATIEQLEPDLAPNAEIGVEVHPADASIEMLERLKALGVNRISLGIETFRPDLLKMLARRYTPEQATAALCAAKTVGFACVDVNLLFGIPGQAITETASEAQRCIELGVDQISAYQLFTFVHTPFGKKVRHGDFATYGDRARLRAQDLLNRTCLAAGLERSSPWNFTRPGIAPYSTVTQEDYIGFGAGAGSKVGGVFWFNTFSVDAYTEQPAPRPALVMETSERFRQAHYVYWRLYRTELDPADYRAQFGSELERDFGGLLRTLQASRTIRRRSDGTYRVTEFGAVWMHRVQQLFSITYIDDLWDRCYQEAWPQEVLLV
ncbi:MAG: radical SAM protein [Fibrella sp.]|nr:radical SAM protein [Armatimonadota bacterium]